LSLAGRLAISIPETAQALGVSERLVRDLLPELPHVRLGRRTVIPVGPLEEWLRERVEAESRRADAVTNEVLEAIQGEQR
jgi:hypothetical protein